MRDTIAGFRLLRELRPSVHGMVYLAEAIEGGPIHAIKRLHAEAFSGAAERDAWLTALRRRLPLDHPNLLRVLACGVDERGGAYVVTQWAERGSLADLLNQTRIPPFPIGAYLASETLAGLIALHQQAQLHGAIKPNNLLIGHDGTPLLSEPPTPSSRERAGTVAYCAPEILRGAPATPRSDLYSLGVTFYEVGCGPAPYEADLTLEQPSAAQPTPPRTPLEVNPIIPLRIDRWIRRLLTPEVEQRFTSAADALRELSLYRAEPSGRCERQDFQEFLRDPFQYTRQALTQAALRRLRIGEQLAAAGRIVPAIWELHLATLTDRSQPAAREQLHKLAELHRFQIRSQASAAEAELERKWAAQPDHPQRWAELAELVHAERRVLHLIRTYLRLSRIPMVDPLLLSRVESLLGADAIAYLKPIEGAELPSARTQLPTWEHLPPAPTIEAPARPPRAAFGSWGLSAALAALAVVGILYLGTLGLKREIAEQAQAPAVQKPEPTRLSRESVADLFLVRARAAGKRGDWSAAAQIYDRFLSQFPQDGRINQIRLQHAAALARAGQTDAAIQSLDLLDREQHGEKRAEAIEELSEIYLERGEREAAKELLASAGATSDGAAAPRALFKLGRLFEEDGEIADAVRAFETISMQFPRSSQWPDAQLRLAELFQASGQSDAARRALEELLDALPPSSPYHRIAGTRLDQLSNGASIEQENIQQK